MGRKFADLHVRCAIGPDGEGLRGLVRRAKCLGFSLLAAPLEPSMPKRGLSELKAIAEEEGIDLATRADIAPRNRDELLASLRRLRRRFELIGVICLNKGVARVAARDRRVDLLSFPLEPGKRFFDEAEAELASGSNCALELDLMPLMKLDVRGRVRLLRRLRAEVALARDKGIPIVISSGATEPILMRKPRELAYLASELLDMSLEEALDALSKRPMEMVERNRAKLSPDFIAPGIRLIRRGGDCR